MKILLEQRYLEMIAHIELLEIIASSNFFFYLYYTVTRNQNVAHLSAIQNRERNNGDVKKKPKFLNL